MIKKDSIAFNKNIQKTNKTTARQCNFLYLDIDILCLKVSLHSSVYMKLLIFLAYVHILSALDRMYIISQSRKCALG